MKKGKLNWLLFVNIALCFMPLPLILFLGMGFDGAVVQTAFSVAMAAMLFLDIPVSVFSFVCCSKGWISQEWRSAVTKFAAFNLVVGLIVAVFAVLVMVHLSRTAPHA